MRLSRQLQIKLHFLSTTQFDHHWFMRLSRQLQIKLHFLSATQSDNLITDSCACPSNHKPSYSFLFTTLFDHHWFMHLGEEEGKGKYGRVGVGQEGGRNGNGVVGGMGGGRGGVGKGVYVGSGYVWACMLAIWWWAILHQLQTSTGAIVKSRRLHSPLVLFCGNSSDHEEVKVHECQTLKHPQQSCLHPPGISVSAPWRSRPKAGWWGWGSCQTPAWCYPGTHCNHKPVSAKHTAITNQPTLNTLHSPTSQR